MEKEEQPLQTFCTYQKGFVGHMQVSCKAACAAHVRCSGVFEDVTPGASGQLRAAYTNQLENKYSTKEHLSPSTGISPTALCTGDIVFTIGWKKPGAS